MQRDEIPDSCPDRSLPEILGGALSLGSSRSLWLLVMGAEGQWRMHCADTRESCSRNAGLCSSRSYGPLWGPCSARSCDCASWYATPPRGTRRNSARSRPPATARATGPARRRIARSRLARGSNRCIRHLRQLPDRYLLGGATLCLYAGVRASLRGRRRRRVDGPTLREDGAGLELREAGLTALCCFAHSFVASGSH